MKEYRASLADAKFKVNIMEWVEDRIESFSGQVEFYTERKNEDPDSSDYYDGLIAENAAMAAAAERLLEKLIK